MSYCVIGDLLTGSIPTPAYLTPQKYVDDAADEMDSYLGIKYTTPVSLNINIPEQRPGYLMLKRINAHLATGRLILAVAAGGEDKNLNAYGASLVESAINALTELTEGQYVLVGASPLPGATVGNSNAPLLFNIDKTSAVEDFYDRLINPPLVPYVPGWPYGAGYYQGG